jgi:polysaccharide export outer membrane protein
MAKQTPEQAAHAAGAPVDAKTYIIGSEDILVIRVWNEPQLSGTYNVRPDGKISMSLINEIVAAGLTPEKLAAVITEGLDKFMQHPEVSVSVSSVNSKKYFIMGEVNKTGSFPLLVPTTVMEALVNAGGFRDFAKKSDIIIIRGSQRHHFNFNNVMKGKDTKDNILLEPGDQIIVR